jgi:hypothetical protein
MHFLDVLRGVQIVTLLELDPERDREQGPYSRFARSGHTHDHGDYGHSDGVLKGRLPYALRRTAMVHHAVLHAAAIAYAVNSLFPVTSVLLASSKIRRMFR